jgi:mono/diheme cytochrome c family protein
MSHTTNYIGGALRAALCVIVLVNASLRVYAGHPKELFDKSCAPCHSKDGTAQTPAAKKLGVKDLSQSKLTDEQIADQIREGKQDKQGVSKMPAYKDKLTADEIKSLVTVVKGFRK